VSSALFSAVLLILAFPPFNIWPCAFIFLIPLLFVIRRVGRFKAFLYASLAGFIFFLGTISWLVHVSVFGMFFVVSVCCLYWGLFGLLAHSFVSCASVDKGCHRYSYLFGRVLALGACWASLEYIRTEIPYANFGWALLAYSQSLNLFFIQTADLIGAYGVSFLVIVLNGFLFYFIVSFKSERKKSLFCLVDLAIFLLVIYGYGFLQLSLPLRGTPLRVGVLQGNIAQSIKWDPAFKGDIIDIYVKLIEFIGYDKPDLVILPEAAYPGDFTREFLSSPMNLAIKALGTPTLIGGIRFLDYAHEYNSAFLISGDGEIDAFYDKINLVPFGEYIPFKPLFDLLDLTKVAYSLGVSDFSRGKEYTVFSVRKGDDEFRFSTLICFEDVFPHLARHFSRAGSEFLVVITNDAWFGKTAAAYQHMQASVFRAIENNSYVVRAANTGVSGFISPKGRVLDIVRDKGGEDLFVIGGVSRPLLISKRKTFFQYGGFAFKYVCVAFLCLLYARVVPHLSSPDKRK
jgi:apolipoprotein N-acyltransferase